MKQLLLFAIVFFTSISATRAQRHCDLIGKSLTSPATIQNGIPFSVTLHIKNLGPDAIKPFDTIEAYYNVAASYYPVFKHLGYSIAANDSIIITDTITYSFTVPADKSSLICSAPELLHGISADSAIDPNLGNNQTCRSLTLSAHGGVWVSSISSESAMKYYPNPMTNQLFIENAEIGARIRIFNMTGQQMYNAVISSDKEIINTSNFKNGIYLVDLMSKDGKREHARVVKQ
ncbi:MAG: T9SS type A sorting domain-containing protein [Taibaiella sp.]|nr:T9SS type A sorting domain-containing protein [Taibaiella sp.]